MLRRIWIIILALLVLAAILIDLHGVLELWQLWKHRRHYPPQFEFPLAQHGQGGNYER
jgi:hypothetical protein